METAEQLMNRRELVFIGDKWRFIPSSSAPRDADYLREIADVLDGLTQGTIPVPERAKK